MVLTCSGADGQRLGIVFYGILGASSTPFGSGSTSILCVRPPLQRTRVQGTGGTAGHCDGSFALDLFGYLANHPNALGQPIAPGVRFNVQAWIRDPAAPRGGQTSDALWFEFVP